VFGLPNILLSVPWLRQLVFGLPNILLSVPWLRQLVFGLPNTLLSVPWLRQLVFGLPNILLSVPWLRHFLFDLPKPCHGSDCVQPPPQKPGSILKPMYIGFVVHEVTPGDCVPWVLRIRPIVIVSQLLPTSLADCPEHIDGAVQPTAHWRCCTANSTAQFRLSLPVVTVCFCSAVFWIILYNKFSICTASHSFSCIFCASFIAFFFNFHVAIYKMCPGTSIIRYIVLRCSFV